MLLVFIMLFKLFTSSIVTILVLEKLLQEKVTAAHDDASLNYVQLFQSGVEAYRGEKWTSCISYFQRAMENYKLVKKQISTCRRTCHAMEKEYDFISNITDVENRFYETGVRHTLCLLRCKHVNLAARAVAYTPDVDEAFEKLVPYDYLQMCFYKAGNIDKALTSAFTYLHSNPGHENMQHNIKFYLGLGQKGKSSEKDLINNEPKAYQDLFIQGAEAFDKKNFQSVMDYMERALEAFLEEEETCRAMCEGPFDQDGMQPDLHIAVANHMTYALKCRRRCPINLQKFDGFIGTISLISTYYHYLQAAYLNLDQLEESCQAAESFLLFYPDNVDMLKKKDDLSKLPGTNAEWFAPRPEAAKYHERDSVEKKILEFIEKEFAVLIKEQKPEIVKIATTVLSPLASSTRDSAPSATTSASSGKTGAGAQATARGSATSLSQDEVSATLDEDTQADNGSKKTQDAAF